jgi:putative DNA-invertase from lambdoid prophage Rac
MKTAIYVRVSTEEQNTDNQLQPLEEEAKRRGGVYEIFREKESTRNTRPIKEELLSRIRRGEFGAIIVWKLDRWGRSVRELALELDEFAIRGILFVSLSDGIDLSTPQGRLQAHLLSAFAEFERSLISERTKAGLARTKARGTKLGRPRKGVVKTGDVLTPVASLAEKSDVLGGLNK